MRKLLATLALGLILLFVAACNPAPEGWDNDIHWQPFLVCVRAHESDTAGGYTAVNGIYRGAYQFDQRTWDHAAEYYANSPHLVGRDPATVGAWDQDWVAWSLYIHYGPSPWAGSGCY